MKKQLVITLLLLQSCILFGQIEFTSPDGKKRVEIHKTADKKYQVIVDSIQHKPYRKIMKNKIYYFTDSCRVAYIAQCNDGYCVVIDGIEQSHYKEIYDNTLTFSPDRSRYGYLVIKSVGLFSTKTCCVIDGEEQPTYDNFASFGITFSPDSKHWAYAALHDKEWFYMIDGVEQPHYNQLAAKNIVFSQDSQHWVYGAQKNDEWINVSNKNEQPDKNSNLSNEYILSKIISSEDKTIHSKSDEGPLTLDNKRNGFTFTFSPQFLLVGPSIAGELTLHVKNQPVGFGLFVGYRFIKLGWLSSELLGDNSKMTSHTIPVSFRIYYKNSYFGPYLEYGKAEYENSDDDLIRAYGIEWGKKIIDKSRFTLEISSISGLLKYGEKSDLISVNFFVPISINVRLGYTF